MIKTMSYSPLLNFNSGWDNLGTFRFMDLIT